MAKTLKPYGVSVDYVLDEQNEANDHIVVTLKKRVSDGDDEVVGTRNYKFADWGTNCQRRGKLYAVSKLLQDRTSSESGEESRLDSMDEVHTRCGEDQWEKERESGGPSVRIELDALARIKGVAVRDVQAALRKYSPEEREKILASEAVKAEVEKIRAEQDSRGEDTIDLDDLAA